MGMPIVIEIVDREVNPEIFERVFAFFTEVDEKFSTYKNYSEISQLNRGEITEEQLSGEMKKIFELAEQTHSQTHGYFNIRTPAGKLDPSGLVKGWAINESAKIIQTAGYRNFYVEAGGDIQSSGVNAGGKDWTVGVRNPFNPSQIVKIISGSGRGIATSGTYLRGQHIYNPLNPSQRFDDVVSVTVIGPNIYEADRFATAAFAMGRQGVNFIENLPGFEAYSIDNQGMATQTSGFEKLINQADA
jgi:thiamine biosynthesis lipoprotein